MKAWQKPNFSFHCKTSYTRQSLFFPESSWICVLYIVVKLEYWNFTTLLLCDSFFPQGKKLQWGNKVSSLAEKQNHSIRLQAGHPPDAGTSNAYRQPGYLWGQLVWTILQTKLLSGTLLLTNLDWPSAEPAILSTSKPQTQTTGV